MHKSIIVWLEAYYYSRQINPSATYIIKLAAFFSAAEDLILTMSLYDTCVLTWFMISGVDYMHPDLKFNYVSVDSAPSVWVNFHTT